MTYLYSMNICMDIHYGRDKINNVNMCGVSTGINYEYLQRPLYVTYSTSTKTYPCVFIYFICLFFISLSILQAIQVPIETSCVHYCSKFLQDNAFPIET